MERIEVRAIRKIGAMLNKACSLVFKNCRDASHIKPSSVIGYWMPYKHTTVAWVTWTECGDNLRQLHIGPYEVWRKTCGLWGFGCRKEPSWPKFFEIERGW